MVSHITYVHIVYHMPVRYNHGTIIRTGITCKKIPCYMRDSDCRWFIVKKAIKFEVMLKIFEFSRV